MTHISGIPSHQFLRGRATGHGVGLVQGVLRIPEPGKWDGSVGPSHRKSIKNAEKLHVYPFFGGLYMIISYYIYKITRLTRTGQK